MGMCRLEGGHCVPCPAPFHPPRAPARLPARGRTDGPWGWEPREGLGWKRQNSTEHQMERAQRRKGKARQRGRS